MNRRHFNAAVAGLLATAAQSASLRRYAILPPRPADRPIFLLEAVVAPRLPEWLAFVETPAGDLVGPAIETRRRPPLFELRTYANPVVIPGIEPWFICPLPDGRGSVPHTEPRASASGQMRYLIPFNSLSHREQFWREVTARQRWPAYQFAIYRPVPALRTT